MSICLALLGGLSDSYYKFDDTAVIFSRYLAVENAAESVIPVVYKFREAKIRYLLVDTKHIDQYFRTVIVT